MHAEVGIFLHKFIDRLFQTLAIVIPVIIYDDDTSRFGTRLEKRKTKFGDGINIDINMNETEVLNGFQNTRRF